MEIGIKKPTTSVFFLKEPQNRCAAEQWQDEAFHRAGSGGAARNAIAARFLVSAISSVLSDRHKAIVMRS
jgi:hypothetical protein